MFNQMTISTQTGGRLANQLYFLLQTYCIGLRNNIDCKYTQVKTIAPQTILAPYVDKLGISSLYVANGEGSIRLLKLNEYYQHIDADFSIEELNSFIDKTILQSQFFNDVSSIQAFDLNHAAAIHIRNGDYLNLPVHNCFNRRQYIDNALQQLPQTVTYLHVYSDDNQLNEITYADIFTKHKLSVIYHYSSDPLSDIRDLSLFKFKILWNSTFSYWSSFISDRRYNDNDDLLTICPSKFMENEDATTHCKKSWRMIQV